MDVCDDWSLLLWSCDLIGGCFLSQPSLDATEALDFLSGGFAAPAAKTPVCPASKSPAKVRFMDVHNGSNHHKLNLFNMSIAYLTQQ